MLCYVALDHRPFFTFHMFAILSKNPLDNIETTSYTGVMYGTNSGFCSDHSKSYETPNIFNCEIVH